MEFFISKASLIGKRKFKFRAYKYTIHNRKIRLLPLLKEGDSEIKLLPGGSKNVRKPFDDWKTKLGEDDAMLISSIPFVRNLIEYKDGCNNQQYENLTSVMHIKQNSALITLDEIERIINLCLVQSPLNLDAKKKKMKVTFILNC